MGSTAGQAAEKAARSYPLSPGHRRSLNSPPYLRWSAVVLAAARVGRAGEPQKLVNTTDLPALKWKEVRGAMALPKPMHNMDK